jgi:hypothetical protein
VAGRQSRNKFCEGVGEESSIVGAVCDAPLEVPVTDRHSGSNTVRWRRELNRRKGRIQERNS